jgi:exodeoxyribonuclease V alpha subunit
MNGEVLFQRRIRVLSIRSVNPLGHGGYIFYGIAIQHDGSPVHNENYVVLIPNRLKVTTSVEVGQWWDVTGSLSIHTREHNGLKISERQIEANDVSLILPSGRHIITLLAHGERFSGIGISKATRLWETHGERLYDLLKNARVDLISSVQGISAATAYALVDGWKKYNECSLVQLLHSHGISRMVVEHAISHFGDKLEEALIEDPYRLLSFCGSWRSIDSLAIRHYRVAADDVRRMNVAVEEVLYRLFNEGHTAPSECVALQRLQLLLGEASGQPASAGAEAIRHAQQSGILLRIPGQQLQQLGAWAMESCIARAISERLASPIPTLLPSPPYSNAHIAPGNPEPDGKNFDLTDEQHKAIQKIRHQRIALISGGAGVGKTTVLNALYSHFDAAGFTVMQASIAGRAAQRMKEATGRPARTLASLLYSAEIKAADENTVIVIDEASMLDIISMYRLCQVLPSGTRLLLVGDPDQLMPVGPGLVFHELVDDARIPQARFTQILRHGNEIATFALSIRQGIWPAMNRNESANVAFLSPPSPPTDSLGVASAPVYENRTEHAVAEEIVRLFLKAPRSTQILCSLRNGVLGVKSINLLCQAAVHAKAPRLRIWSSYEESNVETGFRLGDPIVCTQNLWDVGILNGSLGRICEIEEQPLPLMDSDGNSQGIAIAWADWDDGERRPITEELLPSLELSYALTVHKAQGSQWPIVLVPITTSRLLDRSLLYTAVTRAQSQVLLLGDEAAARSAVNRPPRARQRHTALRYHLLKLTH